MADKADKSQIGAPSQEQVSAWLSQNPQATTTVHDNSLSTSKYVDKSVTEDKVSFIVVSPTANNLDKRKVITGKGISTTTGNLSTLASYSAEEQLQPIKPNISYTKKYGGHVAFFTEEGVFISAVSSPAYTFTTPINATKRRIATETKNVEGQILVEGTILPTEYVPYQTYSLGEHIQVNTGGNQDNIPADKLKGLKIAFLGDSTSSTVYGRPYHQFIADRTGIIAYNYGVSGSSIAVREGKTDSFLERYLNMIPYADAIIVFGGRNDITWLVPIGTMEDRITTTLYGACHLLFKGLREKYPDKPIGVMLPLQRSTDVLTPTSNAVARVNVIEEVAHYYSLPVFDLFRQSGISPKIPSIVTKYMPDGVHLNTEGNEFMSPRPEAFLRTLV